MKNYRKRIADDILKRKLEGKGAVLIEGPKWCGKTTTAEQLAASIYFEGTMEQWAQIEKAETKRYILDDSITQYAWDYGTGDYVVHCSDGDIPKSEA